MNGNSFNTILTNANDLPVSIAVEAEAGQGITLVGSTNTAGLENNGVKVCQANPVSAPSATNACCMHDSQNLRTEQAVCSFMHVSYYVCIANSNAGDHVALCV